MIIGVSGKSGVGKSVISQYIANKLNYEIIDVDKFSKEIRDKYKDEILELVKDRQILNDEGINSKLLGNILFTNKELMKEYNLFVYSKLKEILEEKIRKNKNIIIDTMFLPIMDVFYACDYRILVICENEIRKQRVYNRDNVTLEYIDKRDENSLEYNSDDFDLIVDNSDDYKKEIDKFIDKIKS